MINDFDLTPDEIKQQYPEDVIKKAETFEPHGVSEQTAIEYLKTPEGEIYLKRVIEAAPTNADIDDLTDRAIGHICSGSELPRVEIINEPLVKIVPRGQTPSPYSPFWAKEADLDAAVAEGKNLSKHFGLPVGSEALGYDVYKITPKAPTEVFVGRLAPTVELDGLIHKSGGAMQYLTPNRQLYEDATFVKSVENRVFIPHQKELQIPSDLKNPAIQTIGGVPRADLAAMSEELTTRHGYTPAKAFEAVNARVTLNSAVEDFKAGKGLNTSDEVLRSQAIVRQTTTVMGDSVANAAQVETMNRQFTAYNSVLNQASPELIQANLAAIDKPITPSVKVNSQTNIDLTPTNPKTTSPLNGYTKQFNQITATEDALAQEAHAAKQAEQASKRIERQHITNEPIKPIQLEVDIKNGIKAAAQQAQQTARAAEISALTQRHTNPYEPPKADQTPHKGMDVHKPKTGIDIDADDLKMVGKVGKIAKPLAVVAAGYSIYDEVNNAIDKEATARGKVAAGISTAINATAENVTQGVASTAGLVEGWGVGGIKNNNGLIGGVVGADIGSEVRGEQALNALKNTGFQKTVTEYTTNSVNYVADKVNQAEASFNQAYDGSALQKQVNQARSATNALLNEANQNLERLGNQAKQVYDASAAKPYIDDATQYVSQKAGEVSDFAKRNVNEAVNYAGEQYNQAKAWGEGKWNEFSQTEIGQRIIGNYNNTVAEAKKDAYQYYEVRDPAELAREQQREANRVNPNAAPAQPIELGSNHQDKKSTKAVQQLLNAAGYGVRVTGSYDSQTEQAVRRFQHKNHLPEDGTMGSNDFKVLAKTAQNHQHNLAVQRERNVQLQHKLGVLGFEVNITGKMDKQTAHAIREFEQAFGLDVNGKLTPKEQKVLTQAFNEKTTQQTQAALSQLGYEVKVTGQMDEATKQAITQYETDHGLKKNGVLEGNETIHLYKTAQRNHNLINEHVGLMAVGTHHSNVGAVQKALNDLGYDVPVTNFYGKKTEAALRSFQEQNGLTVDGVFKQADFERIDQLISVKEQSISTPHPITPPANQPDTAAPAVSPEQSKQVEQMVSVLSTNPTFAALAPDVQKTMAAQMMEAAQAVNLQPQVQVQPQAQTVTAQVQNTPEPITQTAVPTVAQAEPQPVMAAPVQSSPAYAAPTMTSPIAATAEVETPARQMDIVLQPAQPIVLSPTIAKLHEQITHHLTQGEFGNQIAHLSEKDQQAAIALATHEATRNVARSVDYVQINKDGDVMMGFDGHKGFSASMNLEQVQNHEANQVLVASMDLQQTQAREVAMRQEQSRNQSGPTITM
jgi:peptidoglycan hydrolase-like protein with peptidoglycan-binding domain